MTLSLVGLSHHVAPVELRERVTLDLDARRRRSRGRSVTPSASRPATAPSCTSPATTTSAAVAALEELAGEPLDGVALPAARRSGGAASLPRRGGARLARARARARSSARCARPSRRPARAAPRPRLPPGARGRQARAHRDGDRREPGVGLVRGRGARRAGLRRSRRAPRAARRRRPDRRARRREPLLARRARSRSSRTAAPRPRASSRTRFGGEALALDDIARAARGGRRRRLVDERARAVVRAADVPARRRQPLFFIDIAVPRDLDPAIGSLDGCFLYDIDDLEAVVAETLAGRRAEAERARAARRRGGGALPRVARVARRRAGDRVAACAGRGDPVAPSSRRSTAASATTSGARSSP